MRTQEEVLHIKELHESGKNQSEISRLTGIPRATVREWIDRDFQTKFNVPKPGPEQYITLDKYKQYVYILGAYLGDGYIATHPRTYAMRIATNSKDTSIYERQQRCLQHIFPNPVRILKRTGANCVEVKMYGSYLPTVFPQHGIGEKHTRKISLADWQVNITRQYPEFLIAGLIDSDGSRYIHTDTQKKYQYPNYQFTNMSEDIKDIFCEHCDLAGIYYTRTEHKNVYMRKKDNVEFIDNLLESVYTDLQ